MKLLKYIISKIISWFRKKVKLTSHSIVVGDRLYNITKQNMRCAKCGEKYQHFYDMNKTVTCSCVVESTKSNKKSCRIFIGWFPPKKPEVGDVWIEKWIGKD